MICQQIFAILALVMFLLKILLKSASKSSFFCFGRRDPSGFGGAISNTVARSSIVFSNSVSADRIVVAASRLLGAAAACVILLSFATEHPKSYWSGCIQAAIAICQQIFPILALVMFLLKILLKSASKSSFFFFSFVFCNSVSADRISVAALRLLGAAAACIILLSFAAEHRKSYWSGCIQAAIVICQQIFAILALVIFLLKILLKSASKSSFFCFGVEIHPVLEVQFPILLRVVLLRFATPCLQIAL